MVMILHNGYEVCLEVSKKMKKWVITTSSIIAVLMAVLLGYGWFCFERNGYYVEEAKEIPYSYTIYKDHVVLEKYHGNEQIVSIPEIVNGKPVTSIGEKCFQDKKMITDVNLHANVTRIELSAFDYCDNLQRVTNGINIKYIGDCAFSNCVKLQEVNLGTKIEIIASCAFSNCTELTSFPAQENLCSIGEFAFANSGIKEFVFNKDTEVQGYAFSDTPWYEKQKEGFTIYGDGGLILYKGDDKQVAVPEGVKTIVGDTFKEIESATIFLPTTVENIQRGTFNTCKDIQVYIPESVKVIGGPNNGDTINWDGEELIIITVEGSYAQQYAQENNIPCEIVDGWEVP